MPVFPQFKKSGRSDFLIAFQIQAGQSCAPQIKSNRC